MLFNKESNGSLELKALIGFIYKSINFDNLKSYIGFAQRDITKIIGKEVFQVAQDHYDSENYLLSEADEDHPEYAILDDLVKAIQYPVAVHAYRRYVPSSDLTHSDKGRQIFVSEQEKPAFEWQIEKDNENLLRLAGEATDQLLEFLDESMDLVVIPGVGEKPPVIGPILSDLDGEPPSEETPSGPTPIIPWKTSEAFLATRELFIKSVGEFEDIFMIGGSRMVFISLMPIMRRVQNNEIRACFTENKFTEIKSELDLNDISEANAIILDKIRQPLALLTMATAAKRLTAEILPDGIFSNMTTSVIKSKGPSPKIDRNEVSTLLEKDGMRELRKLQDYMAKLDAAAAGTIVEPVDLTEHIDATEKFVRL